MKITTFILLAAIIQVSASSYGQKITLSENNTPLEQVLKKIKAQTSYDILYGDQVLANAKAITIRIKDLPLNDALDKILENQDLSYSIGDQTIVIKPRQKTFLEKVVAALTYSDVNCRVVDADGKGLPGASVAVKGKNKTVSTDKNGEFFIRGVEEKDILVVSYVGYQPLEISVKEAVSLGKIVLKEIVGELDEVRLIGYGTTTQRLSTGNTSRITAEDIEKQPVANPLQTLQGRMPGVLVTNGQGLPGTETKIQIRGINSIQGNRDPLYIVDGVPFSATALFKVGGVLNNFQNASSFQSFTPFNSLSPSDIESIDVLKDADATAIYGARGANGVILITTKKGKLGTTKFDFDMSHGISQASHLLKDFLPTMQYLGLQKEGAKNDDININDPDQKPSLPQFFLWDQNQTTDWQKVILGNTAHLTNLTGSISGGNSGTTFLLGGNYRKEGTIYPGDLGYTRGGGHINLNHTSVNNKFYSSFSAIYTSDKNTSIIQGLPISNLPNFPLFNGDGSRNFYGDNYLADLEQTSTTKTDNLVSNGQFGYHVTPELNFKTSLGFNRISLNGFSIYPISSQDPSYNPTNWAVYANNASTTINIEPQLDYSKKIGQVKLQVLVGGTYQSSISQGNFIRGENYKDESLFGNIGAAGNIDMQDQPPRTTYTQYKLVSAFGRINYNWKDKYILNVNYRRDGSSRFGPGKQFGNFGTLGGAWIFSNEEFLNKNFSLISYGKLRASYGTIGNEPGSDYNFLQSYTSSYYGPYQGSSGLVPSRIGNPDYRWEVVRKLDIGLDVGVLSDRVLISASWFRNRSNNQLVSYSLPGLTGFTSYTNNLPAVVENKGLEFSINTENMKTKDFNWHTSFNLSFNTNTLVSFPGLESSPYKYIYEIGKSLSLVKEYSYAFAGIDSQTGNSLFYNRKGEKTNTPEFGPDFFAVGKILPDYYGGISNSFTYKGLQLDFLFSFVKQEGYRPTFSPGYYGYMPEEALQRWQKPGDVTSVPKASLVNDDIDYRKSSYFWRDASYIKLKNLYLSYMLPSSWLSRAKISQFKLYLMGQNLLTFTSYKGSDPELPGRNLSVPTLRTLTAGILLTL